MPLRSRAAGGKSRGPIGLLGGLCGLMAAGCTTPTVAARAVWIGGEHGPDGSRTLFAYAAGEITTSTLLPTMMSGGGGGRLLVEVAPRGGGALIRGVDDSWIEQLGGGSDFRAGYVDLERRRAVPLQLPGERVPANVASFTAAGDALVWGEACPPALAIVPLAAEVATVIDAETGGVAPLRSGGKPARAGCEAERTPASASAADAAVVFRIDATIDEGRSVARPQAEIEALRYPRVAGEAALRSLGGVVLPAGHRPIALAGLRCPGGDAGCGIAAVDPDGAAISVAVSDGECRLLRWAVGEAEAVCVIAADEPSPVLRAEHVVAAISADHYVLREGLALHRYAWATGELTSRPLVGDANDLSVQTTVDGRAVVMIRTRGPMLRVDDETMALISVDQRSCAAAQTPVLSPSGRAAAWTCTQTTVDLFAEEPTALETGEVVRVTPGGMERYQGVPMWALAIDDHGSLLLHSRGIGSLEEVEVGEMAGRARNLYVLAADGELARVSSLEPDPERVLGLSPGTVRRIVAQPL